MHRSRRRAGRAYKATKSHTNGPPLVRFPSTPKFTYFPSPTRYRFPTSKSMKIASPSRAHLGATSFRFSSGQGPPATRPCPHITLPVGVRGGAGYRRKALGEPVPGLGKKNFEIDALARRRLGRRIREFIPLWVRQGANLPRMGEAAGKRVRLGEAPRRASHIG